MLYITQRPDGTYSYTITGVGIFSQPSSQDPSWPACAGAFTAWEGVSGGTNAQSFATTFDIRMTCTDGEAFNAHGVATTLMVGGQLQLDFTKFACN